MIKSEGTAIDNLISFLDNNSYVSPEDISIALNEINNKSNNKLTEKARTLLYKIANLINKRTNEVQDFIDVLDSKIMTKEEKKEFYLKNFPFKNANLEIEKLIFQVMYHVPEYKCIEDLILDLVYDDLEEPKEMKERISNVIQENNIDVGANISKNYKKTR